MATLLLTISPWHIYYSRYVSDHLIAATFVIFAVVCFLKMIKKGSWYWSVLSAFFFILSMYTYYAERLFIPLFLISLFIIKINDLKTRYKQIILFIATSFIVGFSLLYSIFFGPDIARAQMTWVGNDVEFVRNIAVKPLENVPFLGSDTILPFQFAA